MPQVQSTLFVHTQTPLHSGTGTAVGGIDLPIQREGHTSWPFIPGSSLKGVLRDYARYRLTQSEDFLRQSKDKDIKSDKLLAFADRDAELECVFGPSSKGRDEGAGRGSDAADFAGALAPFDMRLLFFPVRSLCGVFAYVTCPYALERFRREIQIAGLSGIVVPDFLTAELKPTEKSESALVVSGSPLKTDAKTHSANMVLEEFDFAANDNSDLTTLGKALAVKLVIPRLATHIAVVSDDMFTHFARNATEVSARIALDYETKTASGGALFYVETVPAESVFYAPMAIDPPKRKKGTDKAPLSDETAVVEYLEKVLYGKEPLHVAAILQIGGEATTGKGLCRALLIPGGAL